MRKEQELKAVKQNMLGTSIPIKMLYVEEYGGLYLACKDKLFIYDTYSSNISENLKLPRLPSISYTKDNIQIKGACVGFDNIEMSDIVKDDRYVFLSLCGQSKDGEYDRALIRFNSEEKDDYYPFYEASEIPISSLLTLDKYIYVMEEEGKLIKILKSSMEEIDSCRFSSNGQVKLGMVENDGVIYYVQGASEKGYVLIGVDSVHLTKVFEIELKNIPAVYWAENDRGYRESSYIKVDIDIDFERALYFEDMCIQIPLKSNLCATDNKPRGIELEYYQVVECKGYILCDIKKRTCIDLFSLTDKTDTMSFENFRYFDTNIISQIYPYTYSIYEYRPYPVYILREFITYGFGIYDEKAQNKSMDIWSDEAIEGRQYREIFDFLREKAKIYFKIPDFKLRNSVENSIHIIEKDKKYSILIFVGNTIVKGTFQYEQNGKAIFEEEITYKLGAYVIVGEPIVAEDENGTVYSYVLCQNLETEEYCLNVYENL